MPQAWVFKGVFDRSIDGGKRVNIGGLAKVIEKSAQVNRPSKKETGLALLLADGVGPKMDTSGIRTVTGIGIDIDWHGQDTLQQLTLRAAKALNGYAYHWWETYQSTSERPRIRIVLPLEEDVSPVIGIRIWQAVTKKLIATGFQVVSAKKKKSDEQEMVELSSPCIDSTSQESSRLHLLPIIGAKYGEVTGTILNTGILGKQSVGETIDDLFDAAQVAATPETKSERRAGTIDSNTNITLEDGTSIALVSVTAAIIDRYRRSNEPNKLRCMCPMGTSGTYSAFVRIFRAVPYLTCTSNHHGHAPNATWALNAKSTPTDLPLPFPYNELNGVLRAEKTNKDGIVEHRTLSYAVPRVTHIYLDEESSDEWWRIDWKQRGISISATLRRDEVGSANKLSERAGRIGLDVNEWNKKELTRYFSDFVAHNAIRLPVSPVSPRMGWFKDGFLWGHTWLATNQTEELPRELLIGPGDGRGQVATAMHSIGTLSEWAKGLALLAQYPLAMAGILASIASVLPSRIEAASFVLEWASPTGTGKTTAMRMAESVWGKPGDLEGSWDGTRVGLERDAAFLSCLPMFFDDTKTVSKSKNSVDPDWAVYRVVSGEGRRRATPGGGTQQTAKWNLVMLSTGEEPIYGTTQSGGARARLLSIQDPPFKLATKDSVSTTVGPICDILYRNYGTIGPAVIATIGHAGNASLHKAWQAYRDHYSARLAGKHSAADRVASHLALLELAGRLLNKTLADYGAQQGINPRTVVEAICDHVASIDATAGDVDPVTRSRSELYSWCLAHRAAFWNHNERTSAHADLSKGPSGGWVGRWDGGEDWKEILVTGGAIDKFLHEHGYQGIAKLWVGQWVKVGFITPAKEGRHQWHVRFAGGQDWCYKITRESVEAIK